MPNTLKSSKSVPNRPFNDDPVLRKLQKEKEHLNKFHVKKSFDYKVNTMDLETGVFEGIASKALEDREDDIIQLSNVLIRTQIPLLFSHDSRQIIGKVLSVNVVGDELQFKAQIDMADPFAKEIARKIKDGFITGISAGFIPQSWDDVEVTRDGQGNYVGRVFKSIELLEISVVAVPANPYACVKSVNKTQEPQEKSVESDIYTLVESFIKSKDTATQENIIKHEAQLYTYKCLIDAMKSKLSNDEKLNKDCELFLKERELEKEVKAFLSSSK